MAAKLTKNCAQVSGERRGCWDTEERENHGVQSLSFWHRQWGVAITRDLSYAIGQNVEDHLQDAVKLRICAPLVNEEGPKWAGGTMTGRNGLDKEPKMRHGEFKRTFG